MKNLLFFILLCPVIAFSQTAGEYLIFEIATINIGASDVTHVESAMATHNNKYHASGPHGARVYNVVTGPGSGSYKWVMGPAPWSALDHRPSDDAHNLDWSTNVTRYQEGGGNAEYIRFDPALSRFQNDFTISKLYVRYFDVAKGKMDKVKELLGKINKVYAEKLPNELYGIYFNEINSSSSGRDLTVVSFFDKYAWMGVDNGFNAQYDAIYGKGSSTTLWTEWRDATVGQEDEIWEYRGDLGGLPALVKAAERQ